MKIVKLALFMVALSVGFTAHAFVDSSNCPLKFSNQGLRLDSKTAFIPKASSNSSSFSTQSVSVGK